MSRNPFFGKETVAYREASLAMNSPEHIARMNELHRTGKEILPKVRKIRRK